MWKKTLLTLLILSPYTFAEQISEKQYNEQEIALLKQQWLSEMHSQQQQLANQREHFLQAERLINTAIKNKTVSANLLNLVQSLFSDDYPLQEESQWLLLRTKIAMANADNLESLIQEIQAFSQRYPNTAKRNNLSQLPISLYAQHQKLTELLKYTANVPAQGLENQCREFAAKYQQIQTKLNSEYADTAKIEQEKLLQEFDLFWQKVTTEMPAECAEMEAEWHKSDFDNDRKTQLKATALFLANSAKVLTDLAQKQSEGELKNWLQAVENLQKDAKNLAIFAQTQPLNQWNKAIVIAAFPAFIKTLPEDIYQVHWETYQEWAKKFELSDDEIRQWKITFLGRAFDNDRLDFPDWRDEQIIELKADNLIERRLRMAIWQKTDLNKWLELLSSDAQNKQEWRYWAAKNSPQKIELLTALSQERGFYPMLAAHQLGKPYHFTPPNVKAMSDEQLKKWQAPLARIQELRELKRFDRAKLAWKDLLQAVNFEEKLALTHYAQAQNWFDLAVEGTIVAKAWDYIDLRLPNAYSDWFDLHLKGKSVSKSFAMAIARQESAWNAEAKSHANAIGLMQMLPSTASQTAENQGLPFSGEQDLLRPFHNIMLGTAHLAELNEKYPNNRILIAAAYNAGSHRVEKWLARANNTLAMDEFIASIPFYETRGYVQNVLAYDFYYQLLQGITPQIMFTEQEQRIY